jgi:hypothetical protein
MVSAARRPSPSTSTSIREQAEPGDRDQGEAAKDRQAVHDHHSGESDQLAGDPHSRKASGVNPLDASEPAGEYQGTDATAAPSTAAGGFHWTSISSNRCGAEGQDQLGEYGDPGDLRGYHQSLPRRTRRRADPARAPIVGRSLDVVEHRLGRWGDLVEEDVRIDPEEQYQHCQRGEERDLTDREIGERLVLFVLGHPGEHALVGPEEIDSGEDHSRGGDHRQYGEGGVAAR